MWGWFCCSVVFDSLGPHALLPTRLFGPCSFPGKNTGVGCHFLLQEIFPTSNWIHVSCIVGRFFTDWVNREAIDHHKHHLPEYIAFTLSSFTLICFLFFSKIIFSNCHLPCIHILVVSQCVYLLGWRLINLDYISWVRAFYIHLP